VTEIGKFGSNGGCGIVEGCMLIGVTLGSQERKSFFRFQHKNFNSLEFDDKSY